MRIRTCAGVVLAFVVAIPIVAAPPAFADRALEVSQTTNLLDYDTVTVEGSGFAASVSIGVCEGVDDGTPAAEDCGVGTQLVTSSTTGTFSVTLDVRGTFTTASSGGGTVDCTLPGANCAIGAAEISDIPGTAVFAPLSFATRPPPTRGVIELEGVQPFEDGAAVTVDGTGFRANAALVLVQCGAADLDARACVGRQYVTSASDGSFSVAFIASHNVVGASCDLPGSCAIFAAERVDVANTIVAATARVVPERQPNPDVRLKRRSDGTIFFDNVYDPIAERHGHAIEAGGRWVYAVQIQNDFDTTEDIRLQAENERPGFRIRYFVGYTEITDVVDDGYVFSNMAPGEIRLFAVQFEADAGLPSRTEAFVGLSFTRMTMPMGFDGLPLSVRVI